MQKTCTNCKKNFKLTEEDFKFLKKLEAPEPTHCPECRTQRRLAWRNEWRMYRSKCARTGKDIISYISPDKPIKVYSLEEWFKDDWDRLASGRDFDFNRPFFEQFRELLESTPHIPLLIGECENCEYTNFSWKNKSCYLVSASDYNEDCMYSGYAFYSRDCNDCFFISHCELCYNCIDCERLYNCDYCRQCKDSNNLMLCEDCIGCANCLGCVNLRKQEYCILNEKLSKEEYEKKKKYYLDTPTELQKKFAELKFKNPVKAVYTSKCEDCIGNNLMNCSKCTNCFDLIECQDCRHCAYGEKSRDCMDINGMPNNELSYECVASPESYCNKFCSSCWVKSSYLTYCHLCRACQNCFGCVSLYRNKFCILNKQYTEEEYNKLVPQIIEHMKRTGEWGEFFPIEISPWRYEETVAQDYFPLPLKRGTTDHK